MYECLGVNCHLHFWQNDQFFLPATTVTRDGMDTKQESALKVNSGEEISCCCCQDSNSEPFDHESSGLATSYPGSPGSSEHAAGLTSSLHNTMPKWLWQIIRSHPTLVHLWSAQWCLNCSCGCGGWYQVVSTLIHVWFTQNDDFTTHIVVADNQVVYNSPLVCTMTTSLLT